MSEWNGDTRRRLAGVFRKDCGLSGPELDKAMAWAKRLLTKGASRGIGEKELTFAITGLPMVMRINKPWAPYMLFNRKNQGLWLEAMSAGQKAEEKHLRLVGQTPLIETLTRLAREAR